MSYEFAICFDTMMTDPLKLPNGLVNLQIMRTVHMKWSRFLLFSANRTYSFLVRFGLILGVDAETAQTEPIALFRSFKAEDALGGSETNLFVGRLG